MELVHNFKISLGLVLQRERQGHDEEGPVRWDAVRLQSGVEEVPFLVTPFPRPRENMDRSPAGTGN